MTTLFICVRCGERFQGESVEAEVVAKKNRDQRRTERETRRRHERIKRYAEKRSKA
jgi:hypothetical protein